MSLSLSTRSLTGSNLVRDYLAGEAPALGFYPGGHPARLESYRKKAREVSGRFGAAERERLAQLLTGGGSDADARLQRFVKEGGLAVTTGQQPGLFGGPLYSVYKALTAAALARRLERELDVPVIPVFWVASEDHDWEEVRRVTLPDLANDLVTLELPDRPGAGELPLHGLRMDAAIDEVVDALLELLPPSDFRGPIESSLRAAYRSGATLPEAFAALLRDQLDSAGVFLLSPETPEAQKAALPVLLAEARGARARAEALQERAEALEAAGYSVQVGILDGGVNLFLEGARGRDRLFVEGEGFRLRHEGRVLSLSELEAEATASPERLSPNVLLRPVVESALVPTLAYVAGPGEMAYYAQTAPVFEAHGILQPVIHPRLSVTVVEGRVAKVMDKFSLDLDELARPHHEVVGKVVRDELPDEVRQALGALRGSIAMGARELRDAVRTVDPTLGGPVDHLRNQGFSLLDDVEKKVVQARKRESGIAVQQIEKAQVQLFPGGAPQERVFPAVYYLVRYGPTLMDRWMAAAEDAVLPASPEPG